MARHAAQPQTGAANPNYRGGRSGDKRWYVDRFRAKYPERAAAHDAVKNAVRAGRLIRPTHCELCGAPSTQPLPAHHDDYSKPLAVVFACRACHRRLDAQRRERDGAARRKVSA